MSFELTDEEPSLLSEIVREVEKLDDEEKKKLLIQLRKQHILEKVQSLDSVPGREKTDAMTDDEADAYLRQYRKSRYEQSKS